MGRKKILRFDDLEVVCCPYCGSADFKKDGIRCKKQRYRCKGCGKTFTATTGTFLANTKKSEAAWKKYVLSLTNDLTLKAGAEIGGMSKNSAFLWRKKLYSCLTVYEKSLVLAGTVWFDEIYFSVSEKDEIKSEKGGKLTGISRNKIAIEAAIDSSDRCLAIVMDKGKPTEDQIYDALYSHIQKGSLLVHDQFRGHEKLVKAIGGGEIAVNSKNPMAFSILQPVDSFCSLLRRVVSLHMGESKENLQYYLDWACLRRFANTMKPRERKKFMLRFCTSTRTNYKRPRKKKKKSIKRKEKKRP